jgi:hypothetical protein
MNSENKVLINQIEDDYWAKSRVDEYNDLDRNCNHEYMIYILKHFSNLDDPNLDVRYLKERHLISTITIDCEMIDYFHHTYSNDEDLARECKELKICVYWNSIISYEGYVSKYFEECVNDLKQMITIFTTQGAKYYLKEEAEYIDAIYSY